MRAEICTASGNRFASLRRRRRVDRIDLVHDHLERQIVGADVVQHALDGRLLFVEPFVRSRCVDDEQDEIRDERLLECRGETLHELRRADGG